MAKSENTRYVNWRTPKAAKDPLETPSTVQLALGSYDAQVTVVEQSPIPDGQCVVFLVNESLVFSCYEAPRLVELLEWHHRETPRLGA